MASDPTAQVQPDDGERRILDAIASEQLRTAAWVPGRVLRLRDIAVEPGAVAGLSALVRVGGSPYPHEAYQLTLDGLLETRFRAEVVHATEDALGYLKQALRADPRKSNYTYKELKEFRRRAEDPAPALVVVLQAGGLTGSGSYSANSFSFELPHDIEEILQCRDFSELLIRNRAIRDSAMRALADRRRLLEAPWLGVKSTVKLIRSSQQSEIEDAVRSKFAMVVPVLQATLFSLSRDRIERLGGLGAVTLHDLAREVREGHGDAGICFEYAVHEALASKNPLIHPLASEVLEKFCKIGGGAQSILFGPEKEGVIPVLESVRDALTPESVLQVGNRGRPPKLQRYIPQIINAYRRREQRTNLPRSICGVWKADLFIGNSGSDSWVGTTVKINPSLLQGAEGLRLAIYPRQNANDGPRKDSKLNLVRLPLPYDAAFMELFYKAFYLVRAFLAADANVPKPVELPDAEDRFVTQELANRREFPAQQVIAVLRGMAQPGLLAVEELTDVSVDATLSAAAGLQKVEGEEMFTDSVSIAPVATSGK